MAQLLQLLYIAVLRKVAEKKECKSDPTRPKGTGGNDKVRLFLTPERKCYDTPSIYVYKKESL